MRKKRDRLEVIRDILATVQEKRNIGPTRLLQLSNLSPQMFKEYLGELLEKGLLSESEDGSGKKYAVTDRGHLFLQRYRVFENFVGELGL
jgi:predicted transcriptional regulator